MTSVNLKTLTDTELYERQNKLSSRLSMLSQSGKQSSMAYNQCYTWFLEINEEMFERTQPEFGESGTVSIIGEPDIETEESDK